MKTSGPLILYRGFARVAGPALSRWVLQRRVARGKEAAERLGERFGVSGAPRPKGEIAWLHAASVGESVSLLPLIEALLAARPGLNIVLTTGTRTSAEMMARRLPARAIHQYAPVDTPQAVGAFFDYWRPSLYAVVESEIWPVALGEAQARSVRTALLSARMSKKSARGWSYTPRSIEALLAAFDAILAQNAEVAERFKELGAPAETVVAAGSLKEAAAALPVDETDLAQWRRSLEDRPLWMAASSHAGEEEIVFEAHKRVMAQRPDALLILALRHPERALEVANLAEEAGLRLCLRSSGSAPQADDQVLMIDRLGEMGLWYRVAQAAFICGSIAPVGGHNPLEPARLGVAMAFGPNTENCQEECLRLERAGGALRVAPEPDEIAKTMLQLMGEPGGLSEEGRALGSAALEAANSGGEALEAHLKTVVDLLDKASAQNSGANEGAREGE